MKGKFLLLVILSSLFLTAPIRAEEEKPIEAWISYKQVGNKVVEVVKVKTNTGKVYEFYPGLSPQSIPKPKGSLFGNVSKKLTLISLGFLLGSLLGMGVLWFRYEKIRKG